MNVSLLHSLHYEVLLSFSLYKRQTHLKYLTISKEWYEQTKKNISSELHDEIISLEDLEFEDFSVFLIEETPYKTDFHAYMNWLSKLSVGELYEIIAPFATNKKKIPPNLDKRRRLHVSLLSKWHKEYFQFIEHEIGPIIQKNVTQVTTMDFSKNTYRKIEALSKGLVFDNYELTDITLIPTWHFRPLSLHDIFGKKAFITFPCALHDEQETLLITKALAEQKRLQMIQHIKTEEKTFTELVEVIGMTKGNIHHHLLLLRSAGLLRMRPSKQDYFLYQFRKERLNDLSHYFS